MTNDLHPNVRNALQDALNEFAVHKISSRDTATVFVALAHGILEATENRALADRFLNELVKRSLQDGASMGGLH
jgi:MoxR-like ATPase